MVGIKETFDTVQNIAQKQQYGAISIPEFNEYANMANIDLFNERLGSVRDYYRLGKAIAKTGAGMNKEIDLLLSSFYVEDVTALVTGGVVSIPDECEYVDSITYLNRAVKWIPNNKRASYLDSTIDTPTVDWPVYSDLDGRIRILPTNIPSVLINYYKTPDEVIYNYSLTGNRPVYNPIGSVDFQWHPTQRIDLIMRICGYIGIAIRDTELIQYSEKQENTIA